MKTSFKKVFPRILISVFSEAESEDASKAAWKEDPRSTESGSKKQKSDSRLISDKSLVEFEFRMLGFKILDPNDRKAVSSSQNTRKLSAELL